MTSRVANHGGIVKASQDLNPCRGTRNAKAIAIKADFEQEITPDKESLCRTTVVRVVCWHTTSAAYWE